MSEVNEEPVPKRGRTRRMVEFLLILVITLLLLEAALRFLGLANPVLYTPDDATGYRLRPNQHLSYLGNPITINQWGVRDARALDVKDLLIRRVLVLGDSVTWGGVRESQEALFTSVAENALPRTEVINCGVNGFSVSQMVETYRHHLAELESNTIVVFAIPRDFTRPPRVRLTGNSVAFPQTRPVSAVLTAMSLARYLAAQRLQWEWLRPESDTQPVDAMSATEAIAANVQSLVALKRDVPDRNLLIVLFPTAAGTIDADKLEPISEALAQNDLDFINLAERMAIPPSFYVDGVHLSTEGHRQIGTALAELLNPKAL